MLNFLKSDKIQQNCSFWNHHEENSVFNLILFQEQNKKI